MLDDGPLGAGEAAHTFVQLSNRDRVALPGVKLVLNASAGLQLTDLLGYAGPKPAPGASWTLDLGSLPPGSLPPLERGARAADDLTGIETVTLTARLDLAGYAEQQPGGLLLFHHQRLLKTEYNEK